MEEEEELKKETIWRQNEVEIEEVEETERTEERRWKRKKSRY